MSIVVDLKCLSKTFKNLVDEFLAHLLDQCVIHSQLVIWTDPATGQPYARTVYSPFQCKRTVKDLTFRTIDLQATIERYQEDRARTEQRIAHWMASFGVDHIDTQEGWDILLRDGQIYWQRSFDRNLSQCKRRLTQSDPFSQQQYT